VDEAARALAAGGIVVVADDSDRENEGDLIVAASLITVAQMAFLLRHGSGIVCAPMTEERADALNLPLMVSANTESHGTAFTVTVDAHDVGTGISAADRVATVRALADPATRHTELRRPGHLFPLRSRPGGVLKRSGHTEATTDLLAAAGLPPVGVITELVADDGEPLRGDRIRAFAETHNLPFLHIADLVRVRRATTRLVTCTAQAALPVHPVGPDGARAEESTEFRVRSYTSLLDGVEHMALTLGDVGSAGGSARGALVRVHSECLTGDVFGSLRCDCGDQLDQALAMVAAEGVGAIVYLRGHEGRGIGLGHKLRAYALQEHGHDTVDANLALGLAVDSRDYGIGAAILADLGIRRMRLITNNPHKYGGLGGYELDLVERVPTRVTVTPHNIRYLRTKRDRMGHDLRLPDDLPGAG
jgi:3,4-dihydroxy 2-butanone 4-phosphate synthase/GTP cyclohydrolase II